MAVRLKKGCKKCGNNFFYYNFPRTAGEPVVKTVCQKCHTLLEETKEKIKPEPMFYGSRSS